MSSLCLKLFNGSPGHSENPKPFRSWQNPMWSSPSMFWQGHLLVLPLLSLVQSHWSLSLTLPFPIPKYFPPDSHRANTFISLNSFLRCCLFSKTSSYHPVPLHPPKPSSDLPASPLFHFSLFHSTFHLLTHWIRLLNYVQLFFYVSPC